MLASNLQKRVLWIERSLAMLRQVFDRLKYLQTPTEQLISQLAHAEQFSLLRYLGGCSRMLREGRPLPESWKESVRGCAAELGEEEAELLSELGDILGSADLESQLGALACTIGLLEERLRRTREYRDKHGRLYRSLGALCGLAVAILLW